MAKKNEQRKYLYTGSAVGWNERKSKKYSRRNGGHAVVPGVSIRVVKTAPFGCPLEIRVRGYNLAIRRNEAESIEIQNPAS